MNPSPASENVLASEGEPGGGALVENRIKTQDMGSIEEQQQQNVSYNGIQSQQQTTNDSKTVRKKAYVKILEQPAGKALRFRYECEGRSAGSIPGVNSTSENKTYPTIEIVGYKGRAVVVVSCVTKDQPYRPHPHNLVGKEGCKKGVCTLEINPETMRAVFSNLGIQCVKKKDIEAALKAREDIRVDPFKTGFTHRFHPSGIDLNSVRLCFQVFTESDQKGRFTQPLPPVVSEPIYDKKAMCDLVISRLCSCSATVLGNTQIILLCEKVAKDDISVRLFEEKDGQTIWEAFGEFQHTDVHKQTAIAFRTPRYRKLDISEPAKVFIQLKRPSDGVTSEALPFEYVPLDSGRKRFLDLRRNLKRKPDLDIFQEILCTEIKEQEPTADENIEVIDLNTPTGDALQDPQYIQTPDETILTETADKTNIEEEEAKRRSQDEIDLIIDEKMRELEQQQQQTAEDHNVCIQEVVDLLNTDNQNSTEQEGQIPVMDANEKINEWMNSSKLLRKQNAAFSESIETNSSSTTPNTQVARNDSDDKTLNDLLEQVAELDGIYSDHGIRRDTYNNELMNELNGMDSCVPVTEGTLVDGVQTAMEVEDSFDDAATYSSLQIAFKNPISIPLNDIVPLTPPSSNIETDTENEHYDPVDVRPSITSATFLPLAPEISAHKSDTLTLSQTQLQAPPRPAPPQNTSPHMHVTAAEEEKLPPLPPKRLRKQDSNAENRSIEANIGCTLERKSRQQTPIIIMKTPDQSPPTKRLPEKPGSSNTLPKQKKPGFFSKLFSRRKSKSDLSQATDQQAESKTGSKTASPSVSRDPSIRHFNLNDSNRASMRSAKSLQPLSLPNSPEKRPQKVGKPVGRSVSSVSGKRPAHLNANVIHIPLKGDSCNSLPQNEEYSHASTLTLSNTLDRKTVSALQLAEIPICDGNMELVAIADRQSLRNLCEGEFNVQLDPNVDLTEAEHFALYTSIPPQATVSEFDETSAYYAPVDAGEILTPEEVAERLVAANNHKRDLFTDHIKVAIFEENKYPAHLKRKRQRTNGDPVHLLLEEEKNQHQKDLQDGRKTKRNCWATTNIPAIKMEPRDTSPQPLGLYRTPHELTPSPQPLSPSSVYSHNTPSPYHVPPGMQSRQPMISPNQQYNATSAGGGNNADLRLDISNYNTLSQQTPQQQYLGSSYAGAGGHWETKFNPAAGNNLQNNNPFAMHNPLSPANVSTAPGLGPNTTCWNLASNHVNPYHQQQQYPPHLPQTGCVTPNNNGCVGNPAGAAINANCVSNANHTEHGLSNLLTIDSEQYVRISSEDQQMLRLNTEDLQISNLSIST